MPAQPISPQRLFLGAALSIVALTIAFPLYQALHTGGHVFFTNGIDEASYLSFPYSQLLLTWQGLTRYSSALIVSLHTLGLSGGYCNVLLDVTCIIAFLFATRRALQRFGFGDEEAAVCALLSFVLPLLATPYNPLVAEIKSYLWLKPLFSWVTLAPNPELLFLRSPEPQLSWTIIAVILAYAPNIRAIPWLLLLLSPFLYSFVRLPLIFVIVVQILPRALPIAARYIVAFVGISTLAAIFVDHSVGRDLQRFVVATHWPVLSLTALAATAALCLVKRHIPFQWRELFLTLVVSTWVGANTQILSGWMISPSKYDEYWAVVVLSLTLSVALVSSSKHGRRWLSIAAALFLLATIQTFARNKGILELLDDPKSSIKLLKESPERVAFDNLLLATTADLAFPRQNHTLLSFTRTYDLHSSENLQKYLCAKRAISAQGDKVAQKFTRIFFRLDWGYQNRGVDDIITMRRRPLDETVFSLSMPAPPDCTDVAPIVVSSGLPDKQ